MHTALQEVSNGCWVEILTQVVGLDVNLKVTAESKFSLAREANLNYQVLYHLNACFHLQLAQSSP